MNSTNCTNINIIVSDSNPVHRQAAQNILIGMGYTSAQITEIAVAMTAGYDAQTCSGGGVTDAPTSADYVYIGQR